jgi:hypothetical protein
MEYSVSGSFDDAVAGDGNPVSLTPGQDMFFRRKATTGAFASNTFWLEVPERPSKPLISIDYISEITIQNISSNMEYSTSESFAEAKTGTGSKITVIPGQDLYFKVKATTSYFSSEVYLLDVSERPAIPTATINFQGEKTAESYSAAIEYSTSPLYTDPITCNGTQIALTPGVDLYIWVKPTSGSFASMDYHLVVPIRPWLEYTGGDKVNKAFSIQAFLDPSMTGFDLTDVLVTNGQARNLHGDNIFDVYPDQKGNVDVIIPYNSFNGASFASNEVIVYYDSTLSVISQINNNCFSIYPNPSPNGIIYIQTNASTPFTIDVISSEGCKIRSINGYEMELRQLNLQDLHKGIYFLKISTKSDVSVQKIILE